MKKNVISWLALFSTAFFTFTANAEVVYQHVVSGTYGQATGSSNGAYAGINVSVDESGTARLITYNHVPSHSYELWYGEIPSSAVTVHGVNSIAVQIDTCTIDPSPGCGYVDAVITQDPNAGGFITDGSTHYTWDNVIVQVAGPIQVRRANAAGTVNGISIDNGGAYIGKYNTASIEVQTGN